MCPNRAIKRRIIRWGCLFGAEPYDQLPGDFSRYLCSLPHTKLASACASYRSWAVRYLLYPLTKLNIFNGEVRIPKFRNRLMDWKVAVLEGCAWAPQHPLWHAYLEQLWFLFPSLTVDPFPTELDACPFQLCMGILVGCLQVLLNICKSSAWVCFQLLL